MNGAEVLIRTLVKNGIEICFGNPGTSEMQLLAAIDSVDGITPILGLFEGVVTGAADGYARMTNKPAATLLHLGPGLSNGMANLHNARRAQSPIINIVGDHASYHLPLDAPLTSDVEGLAALSSGWHKVVSSSMNIGQDVSEAISANQSGRQANLIIPANCAWEVGGEIPEQVAPRIPPIASMKDVIRISELLKNEKNTCLFLGGRSLCEKGILAAEKISLHTGAEIFCETFPRLIQRGKSRASIERLAYLNEIATDQLRSFEQIVTVGCSAPVSPFAYPNRPGKLWPEDCSIFELASSEQDQVAALESLVSVLGARNSKLSKKTYLPPIDTDSPLTAESIGVVAANLLPKNSIISDESITSGASLYNLFDNAQDHDWLTLTGGAIGQGLPLSIGAAIACPDRKIVNLQADGSAMFTNQSLWTIARERLDICIVIFNNSRYAILEFELQQVGVPQKGEKSNSMLSLENPPIQWTKMAESMGVPSTQASTTREFKDQFEQAMSKKGPHLIEAMLW